LVLGNRKIRRKRNFGKNSTEGISSLSQGILVSKSNCNMEEDDGRKSARKSVDKGLLKNIIRHTDAHNKVEFVNVFKKVVYFIANVSKSLLNSA
jgi:hypothetical protein